MPPTLHGSTEVVISFDNNLGAPQTITCAVIEVGGAKIEVKTQEVTAFCDFWAQHVPTGQRSAPAVKLRGYFDTAAGGPHWLFLPGDADVVPSAPTRTLALTYAAGYVFTVETRLQDYEVMAKQGALTEYAATVQPTGAAVWTPSAPTLLAGAATTPELPAGVA